MVWASAPARLDEISSSHAVPPRSSMATGTSANVTISASVNAAASKFQDLLRLVCRGLPEIADGCL